MLSAGMALVGRLILLLLRVFHAGPRFTQKQPTAMDNKQAHPDDQINLAGIRHFFVFLLKGLFGALTFLSETVEKRKYTVLIGVLAGVIFGSVYYINKPRYYRASMVVVFNKLTKRTYAEIIDQLNVLAASGSGNRLARELNLSDSITSNILNIEATNIFGERLNLDTSTKVNQPIKIIVGFRHTSDPDSIQYGIINYINNLPYLKKLADVDLKNNTERIKFADNDLAKLDTLKTEYNRFIASSKVSATFYNNAINPADIYEQTGLIITEREKAQRGLYAEKDAVSLVDGFKMTNVPYSKSLLELLLITGSIGLLGGIMIGAFMEARNRV